VKSNDFANESEQKEVFGVVQAGETLVIDDEMEEMLSKERDKSSGRDIDP